MPAANFPILAGVALMAAVHLQAESIAVYLEDHAGVPAAEMYRAKNKAAAIFAAAGVEIMWRSGKIKPVACGEQPPIHVRIVSRWASADHRKALASAMVYEGVHVTVSYERVREAMPEAPEMSLAYVLVHEITHILQGLDHHSEAGLMKAHWDWEDHYSIRRGLLALSPEDAELMHTGLAARAKRSTPALLFAVNRDVVQAVQVSPDRLVAPDRLVSPDGLIAPNRLVTPDRLVAPDRLIAPNRLQCRTPIPAVPTDGARIANE